MKASGTRIFGVLASVAMLALAGCNGSGVRTSGEILVDYSPREIFERAEFELARNKADDAAYYFAEVERLYPYSDWAKRAIIMQAFSHHQDRNYEEARSAAQRYIDFYPADEDAAYAQYMLALSYYDQLDEVGRDQGLSVKALEELSRVIEVYPDSEYARASVLKFDLAFDHLARKEMEVGRYYLRGEHYGAAINRFRAVVESFRTTSHTAEALYRLVEAYLSLGLVDEAQTAGAVLGYNFQSSEWYEKAYALLTEEGLEAKSRGDNWLGAMYRQMIKGNWL